MKLKTLNLKCLQKDRGCKKINLGKTMSSNRTLMVLPGDGVGPEVVNETLRVVDWLAKIKM